MLKIINVPVNVAAEKPCSGVPVMVMLANATTLNAVLMAADRRLATEVLVKADRHLVDLEVVDPADQKVVDPADQKVVDLADQKVLAPAVLVVVPSAQWPVGRVRDQR